MKFRQRLFLCLTAFSTLILGLSFSPPVRGFFSDVMGQIRSAKSGDLDIEAILRIDNVPGNLVTDPALTTSNNADSRCDNLNCGGQDQGQVNLRIEPNTVHNFSYTVTNTGTVDYENYTGDEIAAWITSDYTPDTDAPFVSLLPAGAGIDFDGTNYINTGVLSSNHLTATANVEQDCGSVVNLASSEYLFGVYSSGSNFYVMSSTTGLSCLLAAQTWHAGAGSGTSGNLGLNLLSDGGSATLSLTTTATNGIFANGGEIVQSCTGIIFPTCTDYFTNAQIAAPAPIFLGAANGSGNYFSGTINNFSLTDTDNSTLLADYVPAVQCNPSDQTMLFGFWDKVSQELKLPAAGNAFPTTPDYSYEEACANPVEAPTDPEPNPMQILLFPASTPDSTIQAEIDGLLTSGSTVNQENCDLSFAGTDEGISPVCLTGILTAPITGSVDTQGVELEPGESISYNYKFVVFLPSDTPPDYSNILVNFGVSTSARGLTARNWREQARPYVAAYTTGGSNPEISVAGNTQPFLDQVTNVQDYLQNVVVATDKKLGNCEFGGDDCWLEILDDGGFDPNQIGIYNVKYAATNNYGNTTIYTVPIQVWNFNKITNGMYHGIALGTNGSVWTWGYNLYGQRGLGNDDSAYNLPRVTRVSQSDLGNLPAIDIAAGYLTSCALNQDGVVYCWGDSGDGALGNNNATDDVSTPVSVTMPDGITFSQIDGSTGSDASYDVQFAAIGSDGNVYTWGSGNSYRTGTGSTVDALVPTKITENTSSPFIQVDVGATGGAAVTAAGQVYVWGMNNQGQMAVGNSTATNATTSLPHLVNGLSNVKKVSYGGYATNGFVMALKNDGTVWNWGWGAYGMLGDDGTANQSLPVQALVTGVRDIEAGADRGMYVVGNDIWGSGYNDFNETFTQNISPRYTPTQSTLANVAGNVSIVTEGYNNAWILSKDGKTVWGIGWSDLAGQEFGNETIYTSSFDEVIPWTFIPEPLYE